MRCLLVSPERIAFGVAIQGLKIYSFVESSLNLLMSRIECFLSFDFFHPTNVIYEAA